MSKIDNLLDSVTIINIPYILKLLKRYRVSSSIIGLSILVIFLIGYKLQQDQYITSIDFSDASTNTEDPSMKTMAVLLGDKKSNRGVEILNLKNSMDFSRMVLNEIKSGEYYTVLKIDQGMFESNKQTVSDFLKLCSMHVPCLEKEVLKRIPSFFEIIDRDRGGVNFTLKVKSTDEFTAKILLKNFTEALKKMRVETLKKNISQQEQVTNHILETKKKELDEMNYSNLLDEKNRLDSEFKDLETRSELQGKLLAEIQTSLASAQSKFKRSKKISSKRISYDDLENEKKLRDLRDKIEKLSTDVNFLENSSKVQTAKDVEILNSLKEELSGQKKQLKKMEVRSRSRSEDQFVKTTDEKLDASEMEYGVLSDQAKDAERILDELLLKKNELMSKLLTVNESIDKLKPMIEFLNSLESKSQQLKILKATIVPDVRFDTYEVPPVASKAISKILFFAYLVVTEFIILLGYLTIRYFFDDKIYDETDLSNLDPELKSVGNSPKYN